MIRDAPDLAIRMAFLQECPKGMSSALPQNRARFSFLLHCGKHFLPMPQATVILIFNHISAWTATKGAMRIRD
jgi:hypothetical protein